MTYMMTLKVFIRTGTWTLFVPISVVRCLITPAIVPPVFFLSISCTMHRPKCIFVFLLYLFYWNCVSVYFIYTLNYFCRGIQSTWHNFIPIYILFIFIVRRPLPRNVPHVIQYKNLNKIKHQLPVWSVFLWTSSCSHSNLKSDSWIVVLMQQFDYVCGFSPGWKGEEDEEYGGAYEGNWIITA